MSNFTPEQQAEMDAETVAKLEQMIADSEKRTKDEIVLLQAKYTKADSALHVFIHEHSQAAFNSALFAGLTFGGGMGYFAHSYFVK